MVVRRSQEAALAACLQFVMQPVLWLCVLLWMLTAPVPRDPASAARLRGFSCRAGCAQQRRVSLPPLTNTASSCLLMLQRSSFFPFHPFAVERLWQGPLFSIPHPIAILHRTLVPEHPAELTAASGITSLASQMNVPASGRTGAGGWCRRTCLPCSTGSEGLQDCALGLFPCGPFCVFCHVFKRCICLSCYTAVPGQGGSSNPRAFSNGPSRPRAVVVAEGPSDGPFSPMAAEGLAVVSAWLLCSLPCWLQGSRYCGDAGEGFS